ncbi:MFS transporter [Candidatus Sumerlaeota bacterium]|nr:MFS transporter [Candidatus Sumerlaeota bacterium]
MKPKGSSQQGLWAATLGFFFGFASVALFGPTAKIFKGLMDLTPSMVALLVAMPALSGSLLRIPFAASVENNGGRKPFLVLLGLSLLGMLGLTVLVLTKYPDGLSRSYYPLLLFFGLLCGCGIATFSVGVGQVAYWFPKKQQGKALGIFGGGGNLAPGIFSFVLPIALTELGLGMSYVIWLAILLLGTGIYFAIGQNAWFFQYRAAGLSVEESKSAAASDGQENFPAGSSIASLKISARTWKTWALVLIYFTTFGGFIALTAWFHTFWHESFGFSTVKAGVLTGLYSLLSSIVRIPGGSISDRFGGERTVMVSLSSLIVGAGIVAFSSHVYVSYFGVILMAIGMGVANAAVFKLVAQEIPQAIGGAAGWVGGLGAFGGFAIPPVMGALVSYHGKAGYAEGFLSFVVLGLVSLILAWVLSGTSEKRKAAAAAAAVPKPLRSPLARPAFDLRPGIVAGTTARICICAIICIVQYWLLTASMEAFHGGNSFVALPMFGASLICFALVAGLILTGEAGSGKLKEDLRKP